MPRVFYLYPKIVQRPRVVNNEIGTCKLRLDRGLRGNTLHRFRSGQFITMHKSCHLCILGGRCKPDNIADISMSTFNELHRVNDDDSITYGVDPSIRFCDYRGMRELVEFLQCIRIGKDNGSECSAIKPTVFIDDVFSEVVCHFLQQWLSRSNQIPVDLVGVDVLRTKILQH